MNILPGETVYSWFIRYHAVTGEAPASILRRFSGKSKTRIHPYLPCYINKLSDFTSLDRNKLLMENTLYPLIAFYRSGEQKKLIKAAMFDDDASKVNRCSLLSSNQFPFPFVNNVCPLCYRADIKEKGFPILHVEHQVSGINVCPHHNIYLSRISLRTSGNSDLSMLSGIRISSFTPKKAEIKLSEFSFGLISNLKMVKERDFDIIKKYKELLSEEFISKNGCVIKNKRIMQRLFNYYQEMFSLSDVSEIIRFSGNHFLSPIFDKNKSYCQHPFKHLLFSNWLMESSSQYFSDISKEEISCRNRSARASNKDKKPLRNILLCEKVWEMAENGTHRAEIAKAFNISLGYTEQIISSKTGLVERRKKIKKNVIRKNYRQVIKNYLRSHPDCMRKNVKKDCSKQFYWCYLYDQLWLYTVLPRPKKKKKNPRVNWEKRDSDILLKLPKIIAQSRNKITWSSLDRALGGHGWLLKKRNMLPDTVRYIVDNGIIQINKEKGID
ncbi:hypothetical protein EOPP23_00040 [Endozoicomonas sp. OPT23]|uniref:TnsD family Tn7-like transposition protein n=1 Tax=Endozoicomonas sp. OPT23 TaxID=2072845 RepID=UPI00129A891E|nr:TnsD family Tn7-like transposition protein [Endozoicomonas sp. OPT23]MRI31377.1 hypothetical protein [Endozoicomonas sp. OPT23]